MSQILNAEIAAQARLRAKRLLGIGFTAAAAELDLAATRLELASGDNSGDGDQSHTETAVEA
ncbi:hypothetical protein ACSMXN_04190 [Jatrophihabitans sp. DSM 45814]